MSARGLTVKELRSLRAEHGSLAAARLARPDLADSIEAAERVAELAARTMQQFHEAAAGNIGLTEIEVPVSYETASLRLQRDAVDELAALRRGSVIPSSAADGQDNPDVHPRSKPDSYKTAVFWSAVAKLLAGENLTDIAEATGLSYNRVVKIRDFQAHPGELGRDGSPGYVLYPGEVSGTLVLLKLRKPRK